MRVKNLSNLTASIFLSTALAIVGAAMPATAQDRPPTPDALPTEPPDRPLDRDDTPDTPDALENAPDGDNAADFAAKSSKPPSPLDLLMKDGIPQHAEKRATLRDDLYALLATAATAKEAKKIAATLQRVWLTTGSDTVSVLMSRASRALKAKDNALALTLLDNVVELAPDHAEVWNRRAFVHYALKDYRAAVGDLRRALALDENHFKALDGLASIFQQIGDDAKALRVYEQLRQVHPHFPELEKSYETLKRKVEGRGI